MGAAEDCEFGLWANGNAYHFLQKEEDDIGLDFQFTDLSDFPGEGETLEDLDRNDRSYSRKPANDSLIKVFKRSHDYIYGNEGRKKDAFWQLLNLIFCKLYDEKRRFSASDDGSNFSCQWLGYFLPSTTETYTFFTSSDDASYVWVGSNALTGFTTANAIVNNGGAHGNQERSGTISLTSGVYYPIRIQFGEASGGDVMTFNYSTPTIPKTTTVTGRVFYNAATNGF